MCKNHHHPIENLPATVDGKPVSPLLSTMQHIYAQVRSHDDGELCAVAPAPELNDRLRAEMESLNGRLGGQIGGMTVKLSEPKRDGFNDGVIIPPEAFPLGTPPSVIRDAAMNRAPLAGVVRVIVVLVDFNDKPMTKTKQHFSDLFFSIGTIATKSVREYFREVTNNIVDVQGDVVGPFRMPQTLATYAHGASGIGGALPNARTMALDALNAANPSVNFAPYDNDGNGYVDAFIVIHAGSGAEQTGSANDIWSHKWVLPGSAVAADGTQIYGYLTVPEDCRIGVCAHELGHLLFGFPDLYDTDGSSEGVGNWCLMGAGSWGGAIAGDTPTHPGAWCKANQNWVTVNNVTTNGPQTIPDVKTSHNVLRLWKDGASGSEYFLVENRQKTAFDAFLPGSGLVIWHIDDAVGSNTNETHYKVAVMQADNLKNLENKQNRGDAGDSFPGSANNTAFSNTSSPNSKSYAGANTCVAVKNISASAPVMTADVSVRCIVKSPLKELSKEIFKETKKDIIKDKEVFKETKKEIIKETKKDIIKDKEIIKETKKDIIKDKDFKELEKPHDGKLNELGGTQGAGAPQPMDDGTEARLATLEAVVAGLVGALQDTAQHGAFIGQELRPDLTQGALSSEPGMAAQTGNTSPKRMLDTKLADV